MNNFLVHFVFNIILAVSIGVSSIGIAGAAKGAFSEAYSLTKFSTSHSVGMFSRPEIKATLLSLSKAFGERGYGYVIIDGVGDKEEFIRAGLTSEHLDHFMASLVSKKPVNHEFKGNTYGFLVNGKRENEDRKYGILLGTNGTLVPRYTIDWTNKVDQLWVGWHESFHTVEAYSNKSLSRKYGVEVRGKNFRVYHEEVAADVFAALKTLKAYGNMDLLKIVSALRHSLVPFEGHCDHYTSDGIQYVIDNYTHKDLIGYDDPALVRLARSIRDKVVMAPDQYARFVETAKSLAPFFSGKSDRIEQGEALEMAKGIAESIGYLTGGKGDIRGRYQKISKM